MIDEFKDIETDNERKGLGTSGAYWYIMFNRSPVEAEFSKRKSM